MDALIARLADAAYGFFEKRAQLPPYGMSPYGMMPYGLTRPMGPGMGYGMGQPGMGYMGRPMMGYGYGYGHGGMMSPNMPFTGVSRGGVGQSPVNAVAGSAMNHDQARAEAEFNQAKSHMQESQKQWERSEDPRDYAELTKAMAELQQAARETSLIDPSEAAKFKVYDPGTGKEIPLNFGNKEFGMAGQDPGKSIPGGFLRTITGGTLAAGPTAKWKDFLDKRTLYESQLAQWKRRRQGIAGYSGQIASMATGANERGTQQANIGSQAFQQRAMNETQNMGAQNNAATQMAQTQANMATNAGGRAAATPGAGLPGGPGTVSATPSPTQPPPSPVPAGSYAPAGGPPPWVKPAGVVDRLAMAAVIQQKRAAASTWIPLAALAGAAAGATGSGTAAAYDRNNPDVNAAMTRGAIHGAGLAGGGALGHAMLGRHLGPMGAVGGAALGTLLSHVLYNKRDQLANIGKPPLAPAAKVAAARKALGDDPDLPELDAHMQTLQRPKPRRRRRPPLGTTTQPESFSGRAARMATMR